MTRIPDIGMRTHLWWFLWGLLVLFLGGFFLWLGYFPTNYQQLMDVYSEFPHYVFSLPGALGYICLISLGGWVFFLQKKWQILPIERKTFTIMLLGALLGLLINLGMMLMGVPLP